MTVGRHESVHRLRFCNIWTIRAIPTYRVYRFYAGNNLSGFASQFANQKCMHATQILFGTRKSATRNARSRINIDYHATRCGLYYTYVRTDRTFTRALISARPTSTYVRTHVTSRRGGRAGSAQPTRAHGLFEQLASLCCAHRFRAEIFVIFGSYSTFHHVS